MSVDLGSGLLFCAFKFNILFVFRFSLDYFVLALFAFVVLDLVSSVLCQEIGQEELFEITYFVSSGTHKP